MEYTKEKWKVEGDCYIIAGEEHKHSLIANIATANNDYEANAHLITSAPDMYEALKGLEPMLISLCNGTIIVHPTMIGIAVNGLKALAKAEVK